MICALFALPLVFAWFPAFLLASACVGSAPTRPPNPLSAYLLSPPRRSISSSFLNGPIKSLHFLFLLFCFVYSVRFLHLLTRLTVTGPSVVRLFVISTRYRLFIPEYYYVRLD